MHSQIASVLEKAAAYIEAIEGSKEAQIREERLSVAKELADKIAEVTGESMDEDMVSKLANSDKDVLVALNKLAEDSSDSEMGRPSQQKSASAPTTAKEAAEAAEASFLNFLTSP